MVQLQSIEQTGHGVPLIVSKYGRKAFDLSDNFITVTITLNREIKLINGTVSVTVNSVLECIKEDNQVTAEDIVSRVGKSMRTIKRAIAELKEKGYIERVWSGKSGYWKVTEH